MELLHSRVAALDIGKRSLVACVCTPAKQCEAERRQELRTFATTTPGLLELRDWLVAEGVTCVAMESTSGYWRGAFYLLEDAVGDVMLVNPAHARNVPGRRTDALDAAWLCELAEHGLRRASFVPPRPVRELRDLTRYRASLIAERTREAQRLEKELEDARIKISAVVSDLLGVSGRRILHALVDGQCDPRELAQLAKGRMRARIPELAEALDGDFRDHHAFLVRMHLRRIDEITAAIDELSQRIEEAMGAFVRERELLETIPGVGQHTAEMIIAEIGADMGRFPSSGNLASWAGTTPGHYTSAGISTSYRTRPGSRWLAAALGLAAICAGRSENTYLGARYRRLLPRLGNDRAIVALQHDILVAAWHMLSRDEPYRDLGADHHERLDPERTRRNAVAQLQRLGYRISLVPAA